MRTLHILDPPLRIKTRLASPLLLYGKQNKGGPGDEGSQGKFEGEGESIRWAKRVINIGKQ